MKRVLRYLPLIIVCAAVAGVAAYAVARSKRTYTAQSQISLSATDSVQELISGSVPTQPVDLATYVSSQVPIVSSQAVTSLAQGIVRRQTGQSLGSVSIANDPTLGTITVSAKASHRAIAAASANAIVVAYQRNQSRSSSKVLQAAITSLGTEVTKLRGFLASARASAGKGSTGQVSALQAAETEYAQAFAQQQDLRAQLAVPESDSTSVTVATASGAAPSRVISIAVLGAGLGALFAIVLSVLREQSVGYVRNATDVSRIFSTPPLAQLRKGGGIRGRAALRTPRADSRTVEGLRRLRVNLTLQLSNPPRRIVIASADSRDGRSFVALNLANSWAKSGRTVLLVESDLRKPDLAAALRIEDPGPGLGEVLRGMRGYASPAPGAVDPDDVGGNGGLANELQSAARETPTPGLSILPAGRVDAETVNLWEATDVKYLFERMSDLWEVVIFDTAPLIAHSEGLILARYADATVLVARVGRTRRARLNAAQDMLFMSGTSEVFAVTTCDTGPVPSVGDPDLHEPRSEWAAGHTSSAGD